VSLRPSRRLRGVERTLIRRIFDAAPPDAINLGLGEPDVTTPAGICLAGVAGIVQGRTGYTSTAGDLDLRRLVAERYPGIVAGPDEVLVTVGSQEALYVACLALVDEGSEILYPDPGYPAYPTVAQLVGAEAVPYPLRPTQEFRLVAEDVERCLTERTALVILCAPSNPTGVCHPRQELERVVRVLGERGIPWLSDEVYSGLTYDGPCASPAEITPGGGVVVAGLSKEASMTGWRIGWLVGPREIVARATAVHQHIVTCAPSISQRAAKAAFGEQGREWRRRWSDRLRARRALMAEELEQIPRVRYAMPDGGFYYFVDVSAHGGSLEVARNLLEQRRVITIPGCAFGRGGEGYLRLSFAARRADIVRGLRAVREELSG
jgi:aspartate/methionine/tyrosine aminotransferase